MWNTGMVSEIVECGCCDIPFVPLVLTAHFMESMEYDPNNEADRERAALVFEAFKWAEQGNLVQIIIAPPQ